MTHFFLLVLAVCEILFINESDKREKETKVS